MQQKTKKCKQKFWANQNEWFTWVKTKAIRSINLGNAERNETRRIDKKIARFKHYEKSHLRLN